LPIARKYSAIDVATSAPRARTNAAWSPVATMITLLASPSVPSEFSMKVANLAAALAEQRDHVSRGLRAAAPIHAEQRALAHARAA